MHNQRIAVLEGLIDDAHQRIGTHVAITMEIDSYVHHQRDKIVKWSDELNELISLRNKEANGESISISIKEYHQLLNDQRKLGALEATGVDNWEGYGIAMDLMHSEEDEDENQDSEREPDGDAE